MPVYRLHPKLNIFPHPLNADPSGVLAVDGNLSTERLIEAYRQGIFPWFSEDEPIMWWFPDPRCVLYPEDLVISKSMRSVIRKKGFQVTIDHAFEEVIAQCRDIEREGQDGTWIVDEMMTAYTELHHKGYAHSVEVWKSDELVGGLYGVAIGHIFYGESMFSKASNASKVALIYLVEALTEKGFTLIDCQQDTEHMRSMGAIVISAEEFYNKVRNNQLAVLKEDELLILRTP